MAAVSASALLSASSWQDLLGGFKSLIFAEKYKEAENYLLSNAEALRIIQSGHNGNQLLEELLESKKFSALAKTAAIFLKHKIAIKYGELCQVIAMTWLGDPAGYFKLQELAEDESYVVYAKDMMGYGDAPDKTLAQNFFEALVKDIEFVQNNPFLLAVLKKLQARVLEAADIEALIKTEGTEAAVKECIELFADFMGPEQMGGLCQQLLDQLSYFRENGKLMPGPDPTELDQKV